LLPRVVSSVLGVCHLVELFDNLRLNLSGVEGSAIISAYSASLAASHRFKLWLVAPSPTPSRLPVAVSVIS
jgi:hypothetical protein